MKAVSRGEVLDLSQYEQIRPHFRNRVIELKKQRRVLLGDHMSLLFENHDTVLLQVQEMLRTERTSKEAAILHEIETFNELIPSGTELSATGMIEYPEAAERDRMLEALVGVETHFYVEFDGERCYSQSEARAVRATRTTAVHYLRFPLSGPVLAALKLAKPGVRVGVDHPAYSHSALLGAEALESLSGDFVD